MENIIELLKRMRKMNTLNKNYSSKYAFVGIGNHSKNNLYPVINYLNIPLKYIVTKSQSTAELINKKYHPIIGTTDLDTVLNNQEINGIFISANPNSHYDLVKKALEANKNVFVEKPPCCNINELDDLIKIEKEKRKICVTGLQKRYSECVSILKDEIDLNNIISYNYRFVTGAYPEGDAYWDLFIHPVDLVNFIFGKAEIISVSKTSKSQNELSVFIQLKHKSIIGNIEISTEYSWNMPEESMIVNSRKGIFELENHQTLTFRSKPGTILSLPKEKIFPSVPQIKYLFNGNNFLPVFENNQLVSQGYFNEINTFINLCEKRKAKNKSSFCDIKNTFELLTEIKTSECTVL
jgi:virulence factor